MRAHPENRGLENIDTTSCGVWKTELPEMGGIPPVRHAVQFIFETNEGGILKLMNDTEGLFQATEMEN